jgi:hypothetical protein
VFQLTVVLLTASQPLTPDSKSESAADKRFAAPQDEGSTDAARTCGTADDTPIAVRPATATNARIRLTENSSV